MINSDDHYWFKEKRLIFHGPEAGGGYEAEEAPVADLEQAESLEASSLEEAMDRAETAKLERMGQGAQEINNGEQEEKGWLSSAREWLVGKEYKAFDEAQEAFDNGDTGIAAQVFADVMRIQRESGGGGAAIEAVEAVYGPVTTAGDGRSLAYAVLTKIGMDQGDFQDLARASRGERTFQNMDLELSDSEVDEIKKVLLPDSYTDKFVKSLTGQRRLEGYQRVLLAPANAIEAVATGFLNLPSTIATLAKMGSELSEDTTLQSIGVKGDTILKIIDQYFSPAEKVAMIAQFVGEGIVGAGIGGIVSKVSKIPKIATLLAKTSKLKFTQIPVMAAKTTAKVGGSRVVSRGTDAYKKTA